MFGKLNRRDASLIIVLLLIAAVVGFASWFGTKEFRDQLLEEQAEAEAVRWGELVSKRLSDPDATFAYGKMSEEDQLLISTISDAGITPELLSRDPDVGQRYLADPLVHSSMTASLGVSLTDGVGRTAAGGAAIQVPCLMLHGGADRLCAPVGSEAFFAGVTTRYFGTKEERVALVVRDPILAGVLVDIWGKPKATIDSGGEAKARARQDPVSP